MRFEFTLGGLPGAVDVTLVPNEHPEALGCRATGFVGFPVCTACGVPIFGPRLERILAEAQGVVRGTLKAAAHASEQV